jgi:hypothetical protein
MRMIFLSSFLFRKEYFFTLVFLKKHSLFTKKKHKFTAENHMLTRVWPDIRPNPSAYLVPFFCKSCLNTYDPCQEEWSEECPSTRFLFPGGEDDPAAGAASLRRPLSNLVQV